jgi:hypothetical protein
MMRGSIRVIACAVFLAGAASPALAADIMVVASNAPSVPAGQTVDSAAALDLGAGQRVTFIAGGGKSLTRNGPYKGVAWEGAPPADKAFLQSLGKLASGQGKTGTTLGAVRGGAAGEPSDPWALDVNRAGDYCVAGGSPVVLWRTSPDRAAMLSLSGMKEEGKTSIEWPAGAATVPWPQDVKLEDGGVYLARMDASPTAKRLVVRMVPGNLASDAHRAVWMGDAGCTSQARALLAAAN